MSFWILPAALIAFLWFLAVSLGYLPPPHTKTLIKICNGQVRVTRGQLKAQPYEFVSEIVKQTAVTHGFIAITYYNRAAFSRTIPRSARQRLRNVLLNI